MNRKNRRKRKRKRKARILLTILSSIIIILGIVFFVAFKYNFIGFGTPSYSSTKMTSVDKGIKQKIYPTLYVTGSDGSTTGNINHMIGGIIKIGNNPAKQGLTILADTNNNYKLKITGKIDKDNLYPTIAVGMLKGTDNAEIFSNTLRAVMDYLTQNYDVPWCNMFGFSSGATGIYRYLLSYGNDKDFPPVKKFLSLEGEFNERINLQSDETLDDVLANGPQKKSKEYLYWEQNYQKINKDTQVAILIADDKKHPGTDSWIPWADTFAIYHFLTKTGNSVQRYIYPATLPRPHGQACDSPYAQAYVEKFFYQ